MVAMAHLYSLKPLTEVINCLCYHAYEGSSYSKQLSTRNYTNGMAVSSNLQQQPQQAHLLEPNSPLPSPRIPPY